MRLPIRIFKRFVVYILDLMPAVLLPQKYADFVVWTKEDIQIERILYPDDEFGIQNFSSESILLGFVTVL